MVIYGVEQVKAGMNRRMDLGNIIFAIIGFSTSFLFCVPNIKRWHGKQVAAQKLRMVSEALEAAEERVVRFQERHDRILSQICASYMINTELVEAIAGARATMNQALDFAVDLRKIQFKIIACFPDAIDVLLDTSKHAPTNRLSSGPSRAA